MRLADREERACRGRFTGPGVMIGGFRARANSSAVRFRTSQRCIQRVVLDPYWCLLRHPGLRWQRLCYRIVECSGILLAGRYRRAHPVSSLALLRARPHSLCLCQPFEGPPSSTQSSLHSASSTALQGLQLFNFRVKRQGHNEYSAVRRRIVFTCPNLSSCVCQLQTSVWTQDNPRTSANKGHPRV